MNRRGTKLYEIYYDGVYNVLVIGTFIDFHFLELSLLYGMVCWRRIFIACTCADCSCCDD